VVIVNNHTAHYLGDPFLLRFWRCRRQHAINSGRRGLRSIFVTAEQREI
jgi:hypothetical protein